MKKTNDEKCQIQLINNTHAEEIFSNTIATTSLLPKSNETTQVVDQAHEKQQHRNNDQ